MIAFQSPITLISQSNTTLSDVDLTMCAFVVDVNHGGQLSAQINRSSDLPWRTGLGHENQFPPPTPSGRCRLVRRPTWGYAATGETRRVEMWRGGGRSNISVAAPFVWRCLTGSAVAPFPHPAHRTGQADLPHPALGQDVTPSPTTGRAQAGSGVRARDARKGARVDKLRPCVARLCA